MDAQEIQFLELDVYSLRDRKVVVDSYECAVHLDDDGSPHWPSMLKVADSILFRFDIQKYSVLAKHEPVGGFWIPYRFQHLTHGECVVRVWPCKDA